MSHNPIRRVNGRTIKSPSSYTWQQQDLSAADAGRTEDGKMHKERIRNIVALNLAWNNITTEDAQSILRAFESEYLMVEYIDPMLGGYVEKEFYVGDRSSPMYNCELELWSSLTFNLIER